jgi:hypothetical protein
MARWIQFAILVAILSLIATIQWLAYVRQGQSQNLSRLRLEAQRSEERGRVETAKGTQSQINALFQELKALSDRAEYQARELKIMDIETDVLRKRNINLEKADRLKTKFIEDNMPKELGRIIHGTNHS